MPTVLNVSSAEIIVYQNSSKFVIDEQATSQLLLCLDLELLLLVCQAMKFIKNELNKVIKGHSNSVLGTTRKNIVDYFLYQGEPVPKKFAKIHPVFEKSCLEAERRNCKNPRILHCPCFVEKIQVLHKPHLIQLKS